jgi:hypothetical protein
VDELAFLVELVEEVAFDLGLDRGVDGAVERRDPLADHRHVLLDDRGRLDLRGRRGCRLAAAAAGSRDQYSHRDERCVSHGCSSRRDDGPRLLPNRDR